MTTFLLRRALPLLVFGSLSLASCTVHNHDLGYRSRDRDHRHGRWHNHGRHDYGHQRGYY